MSSSTSKIPVFTLCQTMRGHTNQVRGIVHLPGQIITCSADGALRLWDLESAEQIGEDWLDEDNAGLRSMALSSNGKIVASGDDHGKLKLWDVETGKIIARWTGHSNVVYALCWSADGSRVASGLWDGTANIRDVDNSKTVLKINTEHRWVWAVMYSPDL